jgi:hypothetical protein
MTYPRRPAVAFLLALTALGLGACGLRDLYHPDRPTHPMAASAASHAAAPVSPDRGARARRTLATFGSAWVNWTPATVSAARRRLLRLARDSARTAVVDAVAQWRGDIAEQGVRASRGRVVAIKFAGSAAAHVTALRELTVIGQPPMRFVEHYLAGLRHDRERGILVTGWAREGHA